MKEVDVFMKTIAEGLKTLSQGIEKIADKVDDFAKAQKGAKPKPTRKRPASKPAAPPKKAPPQKAPKPSADSKQATGIDTIYQIVSRSKSGARMAELKKKTGFNDKKIHNMLYKLKKQGKIKSEKRGIYTKA
jgi:predicted Rossmann fold nucleotide-binding protein DprA/Smf involved in DNA uptake